jgi:stage II sporulation protein D
MMRRALAFVLVAVTAVLGPLATASAADSFTFYGSGWGHGLGMSQWGAYGLAKQGWGYAGILTHFYSSTRVSIDQAPPAILRIGLAQGRQRVHLGAVNGPVDLLLGNRKTGSVVGTIPSGQTWVVRAVGKKYRIFDASGARVGADVGGPATNLLAVRGDGTRIKIPEAGHQYAHGYAELNLFNCNPGCRERVILVVAPEQYLFGLSEVPSSWPMAALKAQVVAARTYAYTKVSTYGQHRSGCNCALYATSFDQVYAGWDKEAGLDGARWVSAVNATAGRVAKYQGNTIQAFYMSSSGGYTENNENVWGGTAIPYLRGVCDPGDYSTANPNAIWNLSFPADRVTRRLGLGIGHVKRFKDTQRGVSGRIMTTVVQGATGTAIVTGATLRSALGLPDDRVWVNANRQVVGDIRAKYDAINCRVGLATSKQVKVAGGLRQWFREGAIYDKVGVGAHALSGPVLRYYWKAGGPAGRLGFPTSDVRHRSNGSTTATFEHGTVTCSASGTCKG